MSAENTMVIPGIKIISRKKSESPSPCSIFIKKPKKQNIPEINLPSRKIKSYFKPIVYVSRDMQPDTGLRLDLFTSVIVPKSYKLGKKDFIFYYAINLNSAGGYQLNVYITFNKPIDKDKSDSEAISKNYEFFAFDICFNRHSIKFSKEGTETVDLNDIKTVQAFLINRDPETSRGTETDVLP